MNAADPSALRLYAHIPGLAFEGMTELPLSVGHLETTSFETWRELDDWVPGDDPGKFAANRPVFYVCDLTIPGGPFSDDVRPTVAPMVRRVFQALILGTGAALPEPFLSMAYVHHASSAGISLVGPTGRNLLLGNVPGKFALTADLAADVREAFDFVGRTAHILTDPHVDQAMTALGRAALPEYRAIDNVVHATLALEGLVSSARQASGSTAAFLRRSVALVAQSREEIEHVTVLLEMLYDLRSRALHGQDFAREPERVARAGDTSRMIVLRAVKHTMAFIGDERDVRSGLAALRRLLDRALRDDQAWSELRRRAAVAE